MEWMAVLAFLLSSHLANAQNCFGGVESFEKTARASFGPSFDPLPLLQQTDQALTRDCINLCKQQSQCSSFSLNYAAFRCDAFVVNSINRRDKLLLGQEMNFFEKICFRGVAKPAYDSLCGDRLWAFERMTNAYLEGYVEKEVPNIQVKEDCEKMCLTEASFVCRSADYDEQLRMCRMSKEDRRSQPQAFRQDSNSNRDYLENQCATAAPTSCRYDIRRDVSSPSQDKLEYAPTADNCQSQCDSEGTFNCRAYTFVNNKCYLSGDDAVSLGPGPQPSKLDAIYGEKKCVIEQCTSGIFTYEKVTGYELRGAIGTELRTTAKVGKTLDCKDLCSKEGLDCPAFVVNYQTMTCEKLDRNSQGRTADLMPRNSKNYFEKVCLRGAAATRCTNHAWAFERVLGYELRPVYYDHVLTDVPSRRDCEERCLEERNFVCRSALYNDDTTECKLSRFDRRTDPDAYHKMDNPKINYLENQCIPTSLISNCPYVRTGDHYPIYTDYTQMSGITSEDACKDYCNKYESFICRSISYYHSNGQCLLSGDDRASSGQGAYQRRQGLVYFERDCKSPNPVPTFTPPTPPSSSTIFPPGNEVDRPSFKPQGTSTPNCGPGERHSFEKVTGFETLAAHISPLYRGPPEGFGITSQCVARCTQDPECRHFVMDYFRQECQAVRVNTVSGQTELREQLGRAFFEGMCLPPSVECPRLWAMERVPDHELRGIQPRDIQRPVSRSECQLRCLEERRFVCKSANYYHHSRECMLFTEDRMSSPVRLLYAKAVDYMENQCVSDTTVCMYSPVQRDVYMLYSAKTVQGVSSTFQCEQECSREQEFVCRSYTYLDYGAPGSGRCMLSAESRVTGQAKALEQRRRFIYAEKDCTRQGRQSTVYPPTATLQPQPQPPNPHTMPIPKPTPFPVQCSPEQFTYERVAGFDSKQLRKERLRTRNQMGVVSECQGECHRLGDRCRGFVLHYANFQTCWWMESPIGDDRNELTPSAESVYFEKICLRERQCGKLWTFERVIGHELQSNPEREVPEVTRRSDCEDLCLAERNFLCRSATYSQQTRLCKLYTDTRRTNPSVYQKTEAGVDYLENQCAPEPTTCQYRDYVERFFPFIDRLARAFTLPDCQRQCDTERQFSCRSVNFETVTRDCALSSADTSSAYLGQNAMTFRRNSIFSEKGTCEQVSVQCNQQDMVLTMNFGSPFSGRVFAKGNPALCYVVGTGQTTQQFAISLGSRCGTRQEGTGRYVNEVVIQQHPIIMTDNDKTIQVVCSFDASDRTVTLRSPVGIGPPGVDVTLRFQPTIASVVANTVPPPLVIMRIVDKTGRDAKVVGLGDELSLRIELQDQQSAFAIFARNLYARSSNGESLFLIDSSGCPTDAAIFPPLNNDAQDKKSLSSDFKAFRFPTTGTVNFEVQIRFCQDQCEAVRCPGNLESFGRRKRREAHDDITTQEESTETELPTTEMHSDPAPFQMLSSPIIVPKSAVFIDGHLYQKDIPLSSFSTQAMATESLQNQNEDPTTMPTLLLPLSSANNSREPVGLPIGVQHSQPWFTPKQEQNRWSYYQQGPKEIDELPKLPEGGKHPPNIRPPDSGSNTSTTSGQLEGWGYQPNHQYGNVPNPYEHNIASSGAYGNQHYVQPQQQSSGYPTSHYPSQYPSSNYQSQYPHQSSQHGYPSHYPPHASQNNWNNYPSQYPSHGTNQPGVQSPHLPYSPTRNDSLIPGVQNDTNSHQIYSPTHHLNSNDSASPNHDLLLGNKDSNSKDSTLHNHNGDPYTNQYGPQVKDTQNSYQNSVPYGSNDPKYPYQNQGHYTNHDSYGQNQQPIQAQDQSYSSTIYPYHNQGEHKQDPYQTQGNHNQGEHKPDTYQTQGHHSQNPNQGEHKQDPYQTQGHHNQNPNQGEHKQDPYQTQGHHNQNPYGYQSNVHQNQDPYMKDPYQIPNQHHAQGQNPYNQNPYQNQGPYQSSNGQDPYSNRGPYGDPSRIEDNNQMPVVTPGIYATTEKPVPQEMPLSLAIIVAPEKGEDTRSPWSIERIPRPAVSSTTPSPESSCPSHATIIATAVTVTIVHIGIVGAAICWYRWHKKKGIKREIEEDQTPFPVRPHMPPATISAAAAHHAHTSGGSSRPASVTAQSFYASPEVTFRSIYGEYGSPP